MIIKPRSEWDTEDLLDYLDGWHAASGLGFEPSRNPLRMIGPPHGDGVMASRDFMRAGREDRIAHREATGI